MYYILIRVLGQGQPFDGYQEVLQGYVQRYTDLLGLTIPEPQNYHVLDADPPQPVWALPDPPPPPPPPPGVRYCTKAVLLNRFTGAELLDLAHRNKSANANQAFVSVFWRRLHAETAIKIGVETALSLSVLSLETGGALTAGRAAQIMDVPVDDTQPEPGLLDVVMLRARAAKA